MVFRREAGTVFNYNGKYPGALLSGALMRAPRWVISRGARSDSGIVPPPRQRIALQFAVLINCCIH
jgi:hypothetical protein